MQYERERAAKLDQQQKEQVLLEQKKKKAEAHLQLIKEQNLKDKMRYKGLTGQVSSANSKSILYNNYDILFNAHYGF